MKTYVVETGFPTDFYPPLTKVQMTDLYDQHLFRPVRAQSEKFGKDLIVKEELSIIGRMIIDASEDAAKTLRQLGFHLQIKKVR